MVNRHCILALLLVVIGAMPLFSCSTSHTMTGTAPGTEAETPLIVTILQDQY